MKKLGTLLLIIYSLGSGLYAQEAQRDLLQGGDSIVTEKAVLLDTLDAVRGNARDRHTG